MRIYMIGICGTGMGSLATLLADAGHTVAGSDEAPRPPMSDLLERRAIDLRRGWDAANVDAFASPDLVIVGNVCRSGNPEALRAEMLGVRRASMPAAIRELLIPGRKTLVVAGTHGKTTTASLLGVMLLRSGLDPTVLVGGVSLDLEGSGRLGKGSHFVIEGDEYDSAFFEKVPKFWSYAPHGAVVTSVQHDHLDIYPDEASYVAAFEEFARRIDPEGVLAVWAADPNAMKIATHARCRVLSYALEDDPVTGAPTYAATYRPPPGAQGRGRISVRWPDGELRHIEAPLPGRHNARNTLAAIVLASEISGLEPHAIEPALHGFRGVKLRQEHIGTRGSVRVYRDFAHHPQAVAETLQVLRPLAAPGRLVVAYQPRSATACRRLHEKDYVQALAQADDVVIAPVGRSEIPAAERLDTAGIASAIRSLGLPATAAETIDDVVETLARRARPGDLVVLLSNGDFGRADERLLERLGDPR